MSFGFDLLPIVVLVVIAVIVVPVWVRHPGKLSIRASRWRFYNDIDGEATKESLHHYYERRLWLAIPCLSFAGLVVALVQAWIAVNMNADVWSRWLQAACWVSPLYPGALFYYYYYYYLKKNINLINIAPDCTAIARYSRRIGTPRTLPMQ